MNMEVAWPLYLIASGLFVGVGFALLERHAFRTNKTTLSRYIWKASNAWGPLPFVIGNALGNITGGLAVHFWWHWCPAISLGAG